MPKELQVSVVIGTYNRFEFLKATIKTVRKDTASLKSEIIVVDGGSTDGTVDWLTHQKDIITILQHNRGEWNGKPIERKSWGYFMNLGFRAASGKYICMLSDDCLVVPGAITNGFKLAEQKHRQKENVGMIAFYWRNWPEQEKYWIGLTWGGKMFVNHGLYLKEALEAVDYIDADNYHFYHADGDLALRIWEAGYTCIDGESSFIEHYSDANSEVRISNQEKQKRDWACYTKRWGHLGDPSSHWIYKAFSDSTNTAMLFPDAKDKRRKLFRRLRVK